MKKLYFYLLFLLPALGAAQPAISLKNAIDTTLANSFEINFAIGSSEIYLNLAICHLEGTFNRDFQQPHYMKTAGP